MAARSRPADGSRISFGLSWQIIPKRHMEMMRDPDKAKRDRVLAAMMQMVKFDIAALEKAYAGP